MWRCRRSKEKNGRVPDITGDPVADQFYIVVNGRSVINPLGVAGVYVYVPIAGTQSWGDTSQTFLGSTPEPSTMLTLASGIFGLAGLARKLMFNRVLRRSLGGGVVAIVNYGC